MRRVALLSLLLLIPAVAAAAAFAASPPVGNTGAAKDVGQTQATLVAEVDPNGEATTVRFDLGTSTSYGLLSEEKAVGSGNSKVGVEIPVQGLTPATTYHFRVVATSKEGTVEGADATFKTLDPPPPLERPGVSTGAVRSTISTATTLTGSVDPNGQATSYRFVYGPTSAYGSSTPLADAGNGTTSRSVSARVTDLQPGTTYHFRLVATSAAGGKQGEDRTFKTTASPTSATLAAERNPVTYGRPVTLRGKLGGPRISGVQVRLQLTNFPFDIPFVDFGKPMTTNATGSYSFLIPSVGITSRAVVIADGRILSPIVTVRSAARVSILSVARDGASLVVRGRVRPATANGRVSVQRAGRTGRFTGIGRGRLDADGGYRVRVPASRRRAAIRVVAMPHDGGAHSRGTSRERVIRGL